MTCSCSQPVLVKAGEDLFRQANLMGAVQQVAAMDETIATAHKELRRQERAAALRFAYSPPIGPSIEQQMELARRHALQARREFRTALASDAWRPIVEGFDSHRDDFANSLAEARLHLMSLLDKSDYDVSGTEEIVKAFDDVATVARERGVEGLIEHLDRQLGEADRVLRRDEDWGRQSHSPLEWWQWLIIIGALVISVAALIACLWWFGCSWIEAIFAFLCAVASAVLGGVLVAICAVLGAGG